MPERNTTEEILHAAFTGTLGLQAAAGLARMGGLFLDQFQTDPKQMAEQNLVKQYLRQAGFEFVLRQRAEPLPPQQTGDPIEDILKG